VENYFFKGIPNHVIRILPNIYENTRICVKKDHVSSIIFTDIYRGLMQECALSLVLFIVYVGNGGGGHAVAWLVEALCYNLEGRGFESR
jgi:hypothetical protein